MDGDGRLIVGGWLPNPGRPLASLLFGRSTSLTVTGVNLALWTATGYAITAVVLGTTLQHFHVFC